jgi:hypothetical protein
MMVIPDVRQQYGSRLKRDEVFPDSDAFAKSAGG